MNVKEQENVTTRNSLKHRMEKFEQLGNSWLLQKQPVIIKINCSNYNKFSCQFEKCKFNEDIISKFHETIQILMNEFTNSVIAYHQNNQVIILLDDYSVHNKEQYFGGNVQDIVSNVASEFTYLFNVLCKDVYETYNIFDIGYQPALFKVKVFNLTKEEVNNYFIFRQNTEYKNAIQNKCIQQNIDIRQVTTETRIELLKKNDTPFEKESQVIRKDACIFRDIKRKFIIDTEIPLFLEDSDYINKHIFGLEL